VTRLLVVTAVEPEATAVLRELSGVPTPVGPYAAHLCATAAGEVTVVAGGVGLAAAAAATATALSLGATRRDTPRGAPDDGDLWTGEAYDAVLSMGIGGGFDDRAAIGETVVATSSVACQLGADSPDGYLDFGELGLTDTVLPGTADVERLAARLGARTGPVLTVATVTGTDARALEYADRWKPVAEAMEGFGVWTAAKVHGLRAYEVRTISNRVGRRDRGSWEIGRALDALSQAAKRLFEEPLL
jgi:futalosine hydrolase